MHHIPKYRDRVNNRTWFYSFRTCTHIQVTQALPYLCIIKWIWLCDSDISLDFWPKLFTLPSNPINGGILEMRINGKNGNNLIVYGSLFMFAIVNKTARKSWRLYLDLFMLTFSTLLYLVERSKYAIRLPSFRPIPEQSFLVPRKTPSISFFLCTASATRSGTFYSTHNKH